MKVKEVVVVSVVNAPVVDVVVGDVDTSTMCDQLS
jgi:hypothetical protein